MQFEMYEPESRGKTSLHLVDRGPWENSKQSGCMMTSSNGNIFRVTGPLCGEFTGPAEFPAQRPVTRSFDVFFYLRLNKRLSKQPWCWWFETPVWSLWRHRNGIQPTHTTVRISICHRRIGIFLSKVPFQIETQMSGYQFITKPMHEAH